MRAVVQRVKSAAVDLQDSGERRGAIDAGLMILLGVGEGDEEADSLYLADKIAGLRIFEDAEDKMNLSLLDVGGAVLAVSQFTLFGDCRRGRRPSFSSAARPELAEPLYEAFVGRLREQGVRVETGVFGADMLVSLANDGPVTLLLDSKKAF